jgi:putative tricarboxylic transport membrane protein
MLGALLIHDVVPSPSFISEEPVLAYSMFIAFFAANFIMLGMQSGMLRVFVLVTRIRMYMLAAVILGFASIGVFALNNVMFDVWTLFWFGIVGFFMRRFGFPLAPMILGVVLGNIAELNLARALAISDDLTLFGTRPWALCFLIIAGFSAFFPWFQRALTEGRRWTGFYLPSVLIAVTVPLTMMGGFFRPALGMVLFAMGLVGLYRARKNQAAMKAKTIDS